jgi:hypothetical protein
MEFGLDEFGMRLKLAIPIQCFLEALLVAGAMKW